MNINTDYLRVLTIAKPTTTGAVVDAKNEAESEDTESTENLRVQVANQLGISVSELGGDTSVQAATEKAQDILVKYASARSTTSGSGAILLDVYAIMELIQEMAQKLRNAMREMRQLELTVEQSQIQAQASQQRQAAMAQLITGIATFAIQAGVTLGSMAMQVKTLNQEASAKAAQGVDVAKQQSDLAQIADSPAAIDKTVESLQRTTDPQVVHDVDQQLADYEMNQDTALRIETAQEKVATNQAKVDTLRGDAYKTARANLETAKAEAQAAKDSNDVARQAAAQGNLRNATKAFDEAKAASDNTPGVQQAEIALDASKVKLTKLEGLVKDDVATPTDVLAQAKLDYEAALKTANADRGLNHGKVTAEHQEALNKASAKLVYAQARNLQDLSHAGKTEAISDVSTQLSQSLTNKLQMAGIDSNKTSKVLVYGQMMTQVSQMIGQLGSAVGNTVSEYKKATATDIQSDQKATEEQLEQIKDMFSTLLTTLEKAISLYQQVTQTESQSIDEISGAIRG